MKKKRILFSLILIVVFGLSTLTGAAFLTANEDEKNDIVGEPAQNEYFYVLDENGDVQYLPYDEFDYDESLDVKKDPRARATTYQVAMIKGYTEYKEAYTGLSGYTQGASATDAAFLQSNNDGTVRVKQAGVVMDVPNDKVSLVVFGTQKVSTYVTTNGRLYHNYVHNQTSIGTTWVGYQQPYMAANATYYSYDGHYFYTNYGTMIDDYKARNYDHAINKNNPYYNYYQFLSHRSKTDFNGDMLNKRITDVKGINTTSKMKTTGANFINSQNQYGINASLMYGVAINESGWGLSEFAMSRNNLFGHKAFDSNPDNATIYATVQDGINTHAKSYLSSGYLNPEDYRYRGPHLGDKQSGVNVKYASDPYWGEKAASQLYYISDSHKVDYGKYKIAAVHGEATIYNNVSSAKKALYRTGSGGNTKLDNNMIIILSQETGADGSLYYKIPSDAVLNANRTGTNIPGIYSFDRDYAYIKASDVQVPNTDLTLLGSLSLREDNGYVLGFQLKSTVDSLIQKIKAVDVNAFVSIKNASGQDVSSGLISTGMVLTLKEKGISKTYTVVVKGDVNGDGQIFATDYVQVKAHIMGNSKLNGARLKAADVTNDNQIYATDYVKIKGYIMGNGSIEQ